MTKFVPKSQAIDENLIKKFVAQLGYVDKLLVLTGAGISTESGIPDYRSENVGLYARSKHRPMLHSEFMKSKERRQQYWLRNFLAWPNFGSAKCNQNHHTIAEWEKSDRFVWLITQNVDGLHIKAGSKKLTELHGASRDVVCMRCEQIESRDNYQIRLEELNEGFRENYTARSGWVPDSDVMLGPVAANNFNVPSCRNCRGIMKTDFVFFGDFVNKDKIDTCHRKVDECNGILVLGSSLTVMSGYRFVSQANAQGKPIFIVNIGPTRADEIATMKLEHKISEVLAYV